MARRQGGAAVSEPKRYFLKMTPTISGIRCDTYEHKDGEYVYFSDYASLQAEVERLNERVMYLEALIPRDAHHGGKIYDYAALQAENELLRKAGDLFIGTYLFASVKGLVSQDEAVKVLEEWRAAKGVQS